MSKEIAIPTLHNTIVEGTKIVGTITSRNDIRLDGELEGDLVCEGKAIIGTCGVINGNLKCNTADIAGSVTGKITIAETLSLKSTARVNGEINTSILSIEPNAVFNGTCRMSNDK